MAVGADELLWTDVTHAAGIHLQWDDKLISHFVNLLLEQYS